MDARIDPLDLLGLELGDAHVLRNAGAIVTEDVLRSLAASRELGTADIVVIGHTDCGLGPGEEAARARCGGGAEALSRR